MLVIELADMDLNTHMVLRVVASPVITPNLKLLTKIRKRKKTQSAISRKRQRFISGMPDYQISPDELHLKRAYIEEWHHRIRENQV